MRVFACLSRVSSSASPASTDSLTKRLLPLNPLYCLLLVFFAVGCSSDFLAQPLTVSKPLPSPTIEETNAEFLVLLTRMSVQPIEIYADLAFRVLDSNRNWTRDKKIEVLEELFRRADEAKREFKRKQHEGATDSPFGLESMVADQKLDGHSIKLRVIEKLIEIDPLRARQMFDEVSRKPIKTLDCSDELDHDPELHFLVLRRIANGTFGQEEKDNHQHISYISSKLDELSSPSELRPALELVLSFSNSKNEFEALLDSLARSFKTISSDPAGFHYSIRYGRIIDVVADRLVPRIESNGMIVDNFAKPFGTYLVKNFTGTQCANRQFDKAETERLITRLNEQTNLRINHEELKPEKLESTQSGLSYWSSRMSKEMLLGVKKLRFGDGRTELDETTKLGQEWLQELQRFLETMRSWRPEDERSTDAFIHQKCIIYLSLIDVVPADQTYFEVLTQFTIFLRESAVVRESPATALMYSKDILRLARKLEGRNRLEFERILESTGDDLFGLQLQIQKLSSRVPETVERSDS